MFGVPTRDLETTWKSECTSPPAPGHLPLLFRSPEPTTWSVSVSISLTVRFTSCMMFLLQKVKLSRYTPWRHLGGEEVQLLLILNLSTRWGWVVSVTPWPLFTSSSICFYCRHSNYVWSYVPLSHYIKLLNACILKFLRCHRVWIELNHRLFYKTILAASNDMGRPLWVVNKLFGKGIWGFISRNYHSIHWDRPIKPQKASIGVASSVTEVWTGYLLPICSVHRV
jgi:hypothetical protein